MKVGGDGVVGSCGEERWGYQVGVPAILPPMSPTSAGCPLLATGYTMTTKSKALLLTFAKPLHDLLQPDYLDSTIHQGSRADTNQPTSEHA